MKIILEHIDRFIEELQADVDLIEDKILRIVKFSKYRNPSEWKLYVIAGSVIRNKVVELRVYCGNVCNRAHYDDESVLQKNQERDNKATEDKAEEIYKTVTQMAENLGLEVRWGVFESINHNRL